MFFSFSRSLVVSSAASVLALGCGDDAPAKRADAGSDSSSARADAADDSAPSDAAESPDACDDAACGARPDAETADATVPGEDAAAADASVGDTNFTFTYGPCPTPLSCDPLMAVIARPLIQAADPGAPGDVSACIEPGLLYPAVPACYAPGTCMVGDAIGICLGMEPPHPHTGYCLKPCR